MQGEFLTISGSIPALSLTWHMSPEKSCLLSELPSGVTVVNPGHMGQHRAGTTVRLRDPQSFQYLDEVGCWHPPLLEVLLTVLLLYLQGEARAKDALGG